MIRTWICRSATEARIRSIVKWTRALMDSCSCSGSCSYSRFWSGSCSGFCYDPYGDWGYFPWDFCSVLSYAAHRITENKPNYCSDLPHDNLANRFFIQPQLGVWEWQEIRCCQEKKNLYKNHSNQGLNLTIWALHNSCESTSTNLSKKTKVH